MARRLEKQDEESWGCLSRWHLAWFKRHEHDLIRRMATAEIVDHLTEKRWMDDGMDIYQKINSQTTIPNERARLLLKFLKSQGTSCFWDFQESLVKTGCADLAVGREKEQAQIKSFSSLELTEAFYAAWEEGRPASVVKVNKKLKKRYQDLRMRPLAGTVDSEPVSLDDIRVNIALLSTDKLNAMCGSPGQRQPFVTSALKEKASSVINVEDMFEKKKSQDDRNLASGGAGSGKSTAFMQKAPYEWSKEDRDRAFWSSIGLFFTGSLTDWGWWKAERLAEVFNLSRFDLTKEEEDEVVRYMKSHSEEVLLVADSLDEARVDKRSLLWQVLTGKCEDLPRLKVIICSRPCEMTLLLSKRYLFHRRLEVVGFTEEKIGQFVEAFFKETPHKATELQAQLVSRPDAASLMHTPLVATMICRLFQLEKALPSTQTRVYESAMLAMLEQSEERAVDRTPKSILDELSPRELQSTMENLCKLAFDALAKKQVVFKESELKSAGCLDAVAELGLLSSSPGVNIAGYGEDAYSFSHHTMLEFFAAVHAVRKCIRKANTTMDNFVEALSVDGDYSRFWPFVSGLLSGEECESLLSTLAEMVEEEDNDYDRSALLLLLLHCHSECVAQLPPGGSPAIAMVMTSIGMRLKCTHLSVRDARATAVVLRQYNSSVEAVDFLSTSMDDIAMPIIISSLQHCTRLTYVYLPDVSGTCEDAKGIAKVIDQNKTTLHALGAPTGDDTFSEVTPAITKCTRLVDLQIGSRSLTNASAPAVAEVVRNHPSLTMFGLTGEIDDAGFASIAPSLQGLAARLDTLLLTFTRLSVSMLSTTLSLLTCLELFQLIGNPIDDDGFQQLTTTLQQMESLQNLSLLDVGVTCRSVTEMEKLLHGAPALVDMTVLSKKDSFLPNGEDTDHIAQLTTMEIAEKGSLSEPVNFFGYPVTELVKFSTDRSQEVILGFFS